MSEILENGHAIILRSMTVADIPNLYKWRNNPEVMKFSGDDRTISLASHLAYWAKLETDGRRQMIATCDGVDVGFVGLGVDFRNGVATFSIYLAPNAIGKGMGRAVMAAQRDWAFGDARIFTITAEALETNVRVLKTMDRIGMKIDGLRREVYFRDGKRLGVFMLSMTRDEWKALQSV
jgi:RimJ/RimL family protein N-acetyltransferase